MPKGILVEIAEIRTRGFGLSDSAGLAAAYPASPIHSGMINDASVRALFQQQVLDGEINDGGHTFGKINLDYVDAPDMDAIDITTHNLPSPYVPNPTSPGPGSIEASDKPSPPEGFGQAPVNNWGGGVGSQLSPAASSASISKHTLGDYITGKSVGG